MISFKSLESASILIANFGAQYQKRKSDDNLRKLGAREWLPGHLFRVGGSKALGLKGSALYQSRFERVLVEVRK